MLKTEHTKFEDTTALRTMGRRWLSVPESVSTYFKNSVHDCPVPEMIFVNSRDHQGITFVFRDVTSRDAVKAAIRDILPKDGDVLGAQFAGQSAIVCLSYQDFHSNFSLIR